LGALIALLGGHGLYFRLRTRVKLARVRMMVRVRVTVTSHNTHTHTHSLCFDAVRNHKYKLMAIELVIEQVSPPQVATSGRRCHSHRISNSK